MKRPLDPASTNRPVDPLAFGFSDAWTQLHPCLKAALAHFDFPLGDYADARMLADPDLVDSGVRASLLQHAVELLPPEGKGNDRPEILRHQFEQLVLLATKVPSLANCRFHGLYLTPDQQLLGPVVLCTEGVPGKQLVRWRSIRKPRLLQTSKERYGIKTQSVREIETELAVRWGQRILNRLLPAADSFPRLARAVRAKDKEGMLDVFGQARWSTLAQHGRNLDLIISIEPRFIPWDTDKVAGFFDTMRRVNATRDKPWGPGKPNSAWKTIHFLSCRFGIEDQLDIPYLKCKKDALRAKLVTSYETGDHRAHCPPMEVIVALEKASKEEALWLDRWFASGLRHVAGASGRFNDYIHTHSDSFIDSDKTLELSAWQTKVTDLLDKKRPMPLIAPKVSFSGVVWWVTFSDGMVHLVKLMGPRDFVFPCPNRDHTGVTPEPLRNTKALSWYRDILKRQGVAPEIIAQMTLSGLRVFMADLAYRLQIPRDLRRYIGRWATDSMADVYTRDHRDVVVKIWQQVQTAVGIGQSAGQIWPSNKETVPTNLSASHYRLDPSVTDTPHLPTLPLDDILQDDGFAEVDAEGVGRPPVPPRGLVRQHEPSRVSISTVGPDRGGPLQLLTNQFTTGDPPVKKAHLCRPTRVCVCGYKPNVHRVDLWTEWQDWNSEADNFEACWTCFRQYQLPEEWVTPLPGAKFRELVSQGHDTSPDSPVTDEGEESADSSDTDLEDDSSDDEITIRTPVPGAPVVSYSPAASST